MKKSFTLALLATILIGALPASALPYIPVGFSPSSDRRAITVEDLPDGPDWISLIVNQNALGSAETAQSPKMCLSLTTNGCSLGSTSKMFVSSILPYCEESISHCVDGLTITKADGTAVAAKFVKQFPGFSFDGIPEQDAPSGSTPSLWQAEGAPNAVGSDKYVVTVAQNWTYERGAASFTGLTARVTPVLDTFARSFRPSRIMYHTHEVSGLFQSNHDNGEQTGLDDCAGTDHGYCASRVDFAEGSRAELSMKLSNQVTGWLHGRLSQPSIEVNPISPKYNQVVMAGEPVEVPTMYAEFEKSKMSPEFLNQFQRWNRTGGLNQRSEWFQFSSSKPTAFFMISNLSEAANDTASGSRNYWTVKSIPIVRTNSPCLADTSKLVGLVTTNAMAYSGSAPEWVNGFLQYEVAGLHYLRDGKSEAIGSYDLAIRSETARCLYGFSKAPISATISVTGSSGEAKIAVTTVSEADGWLRLSARGFTFSSPKISVKLTQAAPKKTMITCAKGKVLKKVTAISPKCPIGYSKKK